MQKRRKPRGREEVRSGDRARLPPVSELLEHPRGRRLRAVFGPLAARDAVREALEGVRSAWRRGEAPASALAPAAVLRAAADRAVAAAAPDPRPVINATGVVVHTNLGRAPLSPRAAARVAGTLSGYVDLEYDVATGRRGDRMAPLRGPMGRLFPDHDFWVVNNNAAATVLALHALARGKEAIVSRGELVEIGGSFRVPEIMKLSGARLVEVGTTNRTRASDYARAIGPRTGVLMKVHTSNFAIVGFSAEASVAELAEIARQRDVPLLVDHGSGSLLDLHEQGIRDERPVRAPLRDGADVVTFSGDKLLGGPQAGILVGTRDCIGKIRRDPLARVCRIDRTTMAALHETLLAHAAGRAREEVPTLRMIGLSAAAIGRRARAIVRSLDPPAGITARVVAGVSRSGGGSSPRGELPTRLIEIRRAEGDAGPLEARLRAGDPPIVARVHDGALLLDLRTVHPDEDAVVAERLADLVKR